MKIELLKDTENLLLERREIVAKVIHDKATPSFKDVRDQISSVLSSDNKAVVVVHSLKSKPGLKESIASGNVYSDKARAFQVERRYLLAKNFPEEVKIEKAAAPKKEASKEKGAEKKQEKAERKAEPKKEG